MKAENYIPGIPLIPEEDIAKAEKLLGNHILFHKEGQGKVYYCSACGERYYITSLSNCRQTTSEEQELFYSKHREIAECPRCGVRSEIINTSIKKKLSDLEVWKAVAFVLPVSEDDVYIRCEYMKKSFFEDGSKTWRDSYEVYRFVKGEGCEYYRERYWYGDFILCKTLREPFGMNSASYGFNYWPRRYIGLERLQDTFFRYSDFSAEYEKEHVRGEFRYLALFAKYPMAVEMLYKRGYSNLIDYKINGYKTRHLVKWSAKSLKDFWKIDKAERKAWAEYGNDMRTVRTYMDLFRGKKDGFSKAAVWNRSFLGYDTRAVSRVLKMYNITSDDAVSYMRKNGSWYIWRDYLEAADEVGYDLTVHNVVFPKNLEAAHDAAVAARKIKAAEKDNKAAQERYSELDGRYGYTDGVYLIRPPRDAVEIVAEGNALKHCVGGYAARHANGETTILFMRLCSEPESPLYTIEVRGTDIRQAHGYKNTQNPEAVPEAKEFIDKWQAHIRKKAKKKTAKAEKGNAA